MAFSISGASIQRPVAVWLLILFCLLGRGRDVGIFRCPRGSICLGEGGDFLRHAIEGLFLAMKLTHLDEAFNPSLVVCVTSVEGLTVIPPQT